MRGKEEIVTNFGVLIPANPKYGTTVRDHGEHLSKVYFVLDTVFRALAVLFYLILL